MDSNFFSNQCISCHFTTNSVFESFLNIERHELKMWPLAVIVCLILVVLTLVKLILDMICFSIKFWNQYSSTLSGSMIEFFWWINRLEPTPPHKHCKQVIRLKWSIFEMLRPRDTQNSSFLLDVYYKVILEQWK